MQRLVKNSYKLMLADSIQLLLEEDFELVIKYGTKTMETYIRPNIILLKYEDLGLKS